MTHEEKIPRWMRRASVERAAPRDFGVEIGAFQTPIPGLRPFFVDRYREFTGVPCPADFYCSATQLPFRSHSLDYVASSHVLEHIANPVAALFEWARVLREGGIIYLVVPDRRKTFDHRRELTSPAHMMEDFTRGVTEKDGTHIADYLDRLDLERWNPAGSPEANRAMLEHLRGCYAAALVAGEEINIHFHVFELSNLVGLVEHMNRHPQRPGRFDIVDQAEHFPATCPNGLLLVLRVHKPLGARLAGGVFRLRAGNNPQAALLPGAKRSGA